MKKYILMAMITFSFATIYSSNMKLEEEEKPAPYNYDHYSVLLAAKKVMGITAGIGFLANTLKYNSYKTQLISNGLGLTLAACANMLGKMYVQNENKKRKSEDSDAQLIKYKNYDHALLAVTSYALGSFGGYYGRRKLIDPIFHYGWRCIKYLSNNGWGFTKTIFSTGWDWTKYGTRRIQNSTKWAYTKTLNRNKVVIKVSVQ